MLEVLTMLGAKIEGQGLRCVCFHHPLGLAASKHSVPLRLLWQSTPTHEHTHGPFLNPLWHSLTLTALLPNTVKPVLHSERRTCFTGCFNVSGAVNAAQAFTVEINGKMTEVILQMLFMVYFYAVWSHRRSGLKIHETSMKI